MFGLVVVLPTSHSGGILPCPVGSRTLLSCVLPAILACVHTRGECRRKTGQREERTGGPRMVTTQSPSRRGVQRTGEASETGGQAVTLRRRDVCHPGSQRCPCGSSAGHTHTSSRSANVVIRGMTAGYSITAARPPACPPPTNAAHSTPCRPKVAPHPRSPSIHSRVRTSHTSCTYTHS